MCSGSGCCEVVPRSRRRRDNVCNVRNTLLRYRRSFHRASHFRRCTVRRTSSLSLYTCKYTVQYKYSTVRVQYKLTITIHRCLSHQASWYLAEYCVPVSEVPGRQHLRSARCHQQYCQFREFAAALSGLVHFLSPDQRPGIHCLIICAIQLLTPNNLGGN